MQLVGLLANRSGNAQARETDMGESPERLAIWVNCGTRDEGFQASDGQRGKGRLDYVQTQAPNNRP